MRNSMRRAFLAAFFALTLAVIVVPDWCRYVPAWARWYLGCPECDGSEAGNDAAGGGCSGASELRTPERLTASAGRRTFEARRR